GATPAAQAAALARRAGPGAPARRAFATLADSLLGDPMFRSAHWGVLVVDPASGDTLYSRNAGKLFMPASNQKLLTGAVALAQLGPDFRFTTRVLGAAYPIHGILTGDLAVVGEGDPSVSDSLAGGDAMAPLRALADSLAARGITEVTGRLVRGADTFADSSLGFGWAWDDLDYDYSAPVDELFFNEGFARVTVVGGATAGAPVTVRTAPATTVPALGRIEVVTIAANRAANGAANGAAAGAASGSGTGSSAIPARSHVEWAGDVRGPRPRVDLRGAVRAGDSVTVEVALRHPAAAWLDAFHEALRARGITVHGGVAPDALADTAGMVTLATRESPPLSAILPYFEKPSQNQFGEILFKTLGRVRAGAGTADSGRAVVERQLVAWGADSAGFAVRDGSGLSRHDYVSPETIVRVLDAMRRHPAFRTYYDALPIAGVDGTIRTRMRGTPAAGNVHAKTGTLDKARALSGYVTTADGRLLLFSMLANNHVVPNREVERVQDALAAFLAGAALGTAP
ncbi:MAG: D-alanyl-D-alanine carboxypeptidase/D-alanyl-D-alanine-endopeptidase, partial [Gemmatimonadaceae bacterium]|nr:D-alanyl-D-alanine carboxypeptidase/D-alanyl-D-alanine-endopeptidase [Gemmatimonadaceae bacterium]